MAEITAQAVNEFRKATGLGLMECKTLLKEADGDLKKAETLAKEKHGKNAENRAGRVDQGRPGRGLHPPRRQVGRDDRGQLRDRLRRPQRRVPPARQGPGPPRHGRQPDVRPPRGRPGRRWSPSRSGSSSTQAADKPENIREKIAEGKLNAWYGESVLLDQKFVKDDAKTIREVILAVNARTGENITVARFARFVVGEGR